MRLMITTVLSQIETGGSRGAAARHCSNMLTAWVPLRGPGEQAGPTTVQTNANRRDPSTKICRIFALVRPRFRQELADLANCQQVPSVGLSRRQRGFESRWGYCAQYAHRSQRPTDDIAGTASPTLSCRGLVTGIDLLVEEASHPVKWLSPLSEIPRRCGALH